MKTILKNILWWIPLSVIGMLNGMLRGVLLSRVFPEFMARQVSFLLMVLWILFYIQAIYEKLRIHTYANAWIVGVTWLCLTVAFEFTLGFIVGSSLEYMLAEYNFLSGRLWLLVLVAIACGPTLYFKFGEHAPATNINEKSS